MKWKCAVLATLVVIAGARTSDLAADVRPPVEPTPVSRVIDYEPAWSPDGQQLAFISNRNGPLKVFAMRADGSQPRQLTRGTDEDDAPAWSPDGKHLAFVSIHEGNPDVYIMLADGSGITRLTNHPGMDIHPQWSPDGQSILWNSSRNARHKAEPETFELFTMRADGSEVRH